jgi:hypothetical protein
MTAFCFYDLKLEMFLMIMLKLLAVVITDLSFPFQGKDSIP